VGNQGTDPALRGRYPKWGNMNDHNHSAMSSKTKRLSLTRNLQADSPEETMHFYRNRFFTKAFVEDPVVGGEVQVRYEEEPAPSPAPQTPPKAAAPNASAPATPPQAAEPPKPVAPASQTASELSASSTDVAVSASNPGGPAVSSCSPAQAEPQVPKTKLAAAPFYAAALPAVPKWNKTAPADLSSQPAEQPAAAPPAEASAAQPAASAAQPAAASTAQPATAPVLQPAAGLAAQTAAAPPTLEVAEPAQPKAAPQQPPQPAPPTAEASHKAAFKVPAAVPGADPLPAAAQLAADEPKGKPAAKPAVKAPPQPKQTTATPAKTAALAVPPKARPASAAASAVPAATAVPAASAASASSSTSREAAEPQTAAEPKTAAVPKSSLARKRLAWAPEVRLFEPSERCRNDPWAWLRLHSLEVYSVGVEYLSQTRGISDEIRAECRDLQAKARPLWLDDRLGKRFLADLVAAVPDEVEVLNTRKGFFDPEAGGSLKYHVGYYPDNLKNMVTQKAFRGWLEDALEKLFLQTEARRLDPAAEPTSIHMLAWCNRGTHRSVAGCRILAHVAGVLGMRSSLSCTYFYKLIFFH
jgi:hypothetical protein